MNASAKMPKYKCHKIVHALKIKTSNTTMHDGMLLIFDTRNGFEPIDIPESEVQPFLNMTDNDQGYLVVYPDGYRSWSPTKAFEEGYTKI